MSSGKKIILEHFRREGSQLNSLEEKIARLETATKQKLKEFSDSSKKTRLYAERAYDLTGVKRNLFETQLKHMPLSKPSALLSSPEQSNEHNPNPPALPPKRDRTAPVPSKENEELQQLRQQNKQLMHRLNHSTIAKLQEQLELLAMVEHMQSSLKLHTRKKLSANRNQ